MLETDEELSLSESESDESELLDDEDLKSFKFHISYSRALFAENLENTYRLSTYVLSLIFRTFILIHQKIYLTGLNNQFRN